jgi:hypothetical protein
MQHIIEDFGGFYRKVGQIMVGWCRWTHQTHVESAWSLALETKV